MNIFRPGGTELTEKAAELMALKSGSRVLDVGCGLGGSLEFLKKKYGVSPLGIDCSKAVVERADKEYITQANAESLPFPGDSFDGVFMECVLTMLKDKKAALKEAYRVIKPGGSVAVSALSAPNLGVLCDEGRVDFSILKELLIQTGFSLQHFSDETPALRRFAADVIFKYDSFEAYARCAEQALGSCVIDCGVPMKGTGYALLLARAEK